MPKRRGNNPKRNIALAGRIDRETLRRLQAEARYTGSAHHKRRPADYGFNPPVSPRPDKSLCDANRAVPLAEAEALFREGVARGMVSVYSAGGLPKYVWAVDSGGRAYEAKIGGADNREYHGYELGGNETPMKRQVLKAWRARCPAG